MSYIISGGNTSLGITSNQGIQGATDGNGGTNETEVKQIVFDNAVLKNGNTDGVALSLGTNDDYNVEINRNNKRVIELTESGNGVKRIRLPNGSLDIVDDDEVTNQHRFRFNSSVLTSIIKRNNNDGSFGSQIEFEDATKDIISTSNNFVLKNGNSLKFKDSAKGDTDFSIIQHDQDELTLGHANTSGISEIKMDSTNNEVVLTASDVRIAGGQIQLESGASKLLLNKTGDFSTISSIDGAQDPTGFVFDSSNNTINVNGTFNNVEAATVVTDQFTATSNVSDKNGSWNVDTTISDYANTADRIKFETYEGGVNTQVIKKLFFEGSKASSGALLVTDLFTTNINSIPVALSDKFNIVITSSLVTDDTVENLLSLPDSIRLTADGQIIERDATGTITANTNFTARGAPSNTLNNYDSFSIQSSAPDSLSVFLTATATNYVIFNGTGVSQRRFFIVADDNCQDFDLSVNTGFSFNDLSTGSPGWTVTTSNVDLTVVGGQGNERFYSVNPIQDNVVYVFYLDDIQFLSGAPTVDWTLGISSFKVDYLSLAQNAAAQIPTYANGVYISADGIIYSGLGTTAATFGAMGVPGNNTEQDPKPGDIYTFQVVDNRAQVKLIRSGVSYTLGFDIALDPDVDYYLQVGDRRVTGIETWTVRTNDVSLTNNSSANFLNQVVSSSATTVRIPDAGQDSDGKGIDDVELVTKESQQIIEGNKSFNQFRILSSFKNRAQETALGTFFWVFPSVNNSGSGVNPGSDPLLESKDPVYDATYIAQKGYGADLGSQKNIALIKPLGAPPKRSFSPKSAQRSVDATNDFYSPPTYHFTINYISNYFADLDNITYIGMSGNKQNDAKAHDAITLINNDWVLGSNLIVYKQNDVGVLTTTDVKAIVSASPEEQILLEGDQVEFITGNNLLSINLTRNGTTYNLITDQSATDISLSVAWRPAIIETSARNSWKISSFSHLQETAAENTEKVRIQVEAIGDQDAKLIIPSIKGPTNMLVSNTDNQTPQFIDSLMVTKGLSANLLCTKHYDVILYKAVDVWGVDFVELGKYGGRDGYSIFLDRLFSDTQKIRFYSETIPANSRIDLILPDTSTFHPNVDYLNVDNKQQTIDMYLSCGFELEFNIDSTTITNNDSGNSMHILTSGSDNIILGSSLLISSVFTKPNPFKVKIYYEPDVMPISTAGSSFSLNGWVIQVIQYN